jgi:chemotaxis protein CheZ
MSEDLEDIDALFDQLVAHPETANFHHQPHTALDAVADQQVEALVNAKKVVGDQALYDRLGNVVRQLHDALRELGYEQILDDTLREISDSQDRLEYIASLTEQAANKVLNAVDEGMPIEVEQITQAKLFEQRWQAMEDGHLSPEEIQLLAKESRDFAATVVRNSEAEKARLMEIMMAQDFQDITGQIIKKVVALTQKLEKELAQILRDYASVSGREKPVDLLAGPSVPDLAMVQDDVDSMLADLGF